MALFIYNLYPLAINVVVLSDFKHKQEELHPFEKLVFFKNQTEIKVKNTISYIYIKGYARLVIHYEMSSFHT